ADGKELASKKQSMKHFLLSNPDAAASSAKGATKMAFLEKFLVHQLRCKDAEKKSPSEKTKKTSNITYNDVQWMSQDKMDAELGEAKAKHWRECGKLRSRPDRLTGSTDPLLVEWPVPTEWQRMSDEDIHAFMLQVSGDADEEDLATFNSAMAASSDVKIKEEPETETTKMDKRVEELRAGVQDKLRVYHDMHADAKVIKTKIGASSDNGKYSETFVKDLDKHIAKLARATKILDRMCTEEVNDTELPKLINTLDAIDKEDVSIKEWAVRFNAYTPKPTGEGGNKRRRTKRE
ncbi:unnamed protein product, partial [Prorocentrum cordatum]